jgi:hypothetical protein
MTSKEFVLWLQGFTQGVHEYNITPKQWDALKDTLATVKDEPTLIIPINTPTTEAPNAQSFPTWQHPHYVDPSNPYTINCNTGSFGTTSIGTITTTPGGGSITYATPQFVTFTTSGTASGYPSGSVWNYTLTQTEPTPPTSGKQLLTENHD